MEDFLLNQYLLKKHYYLRFLSKIIQNFIVTRKKGTKRRWNKKGEMD